MFDRYTVYPMLFADSCFWLAEKYGILFDNIPLFSDVNRGIYPQEALECIHIQYDWKPKLDQTVQAWSKPGGPSMIL